MLKSLSSIEALLIDEHLITEDQLNIAKESQQNLGDTLEQVLIDKGFVTEEQILKLIAKSMNTSFVSLARYKIDSHTVKSLPAALAKKHRVIPLFKIENKVTVATSNPLDLESLDIIAQALKANVEPVLALDRDIELALNEYYRGEGLMSEEATAKVEVLTSESRSAPKTDAEKLQKQASGEEVVNAVNNIFVQALTDRASDIHLEPSRDGFKVRFRMDGVLEELTTLPKAMHLPVVSRIKIMGNMDVAESRVTQDGRVRLRINGKEVDIRIATYPTMFGEAAAIRLLSKEQLITLPQLGLCEGDLKIFQKLIESPHGIFLVTGPTGSGKSTTLYAALMNINSKDKHILSIEDPVEHEIQGVDQEQVNLKAGMTFASALRAMLRQDPDVIMVGEIRDFETADIAMRAAMTGHLVFSTLHTNSAVGAISRLVDLGIEPYLASSSLIGVLAQRLVRRICPHCKTETTLTSTEVARLGTLLGDSKVFKGKGCKQCRNTGYQGRIGLFEQLVIHEDLRKMISEKKSESDLYAYLNKENYRSMLVDGIEKIKQGVTTAEEVLKVTVEA